MKSILFTNSSWGVPLLSAMYSCNMLHGVVLTDYDNDVNNNISKFVSTNGVPHICCDRHKVNAELQTWLEDIKPDVGLCLAYPFKLPLPVLDCFEHGIWNFHFGAIPENAGADPVFWTLKNGQTSATLTVHKMTEVLDHGYQLLRKNLSVYPGENHGLLGHRLGQLSADLLPELLEKVSTANDEKISLSKNGAPMRRPSWEDLVINWEEQTAEEIEWLINASNSLYGGAITYYNGGLVRLLEVSPADVNNATLLSPGSIVHSDPQNGVFVLCKDYRFLRINILSISDCTISGTKLSALGAKANDRFTTEPILKTNNQLTNLTA